MTRAAIKHSEEALRTAMLSHDVEALESLLDDELLFVGPNGELVTKEDDLESHRSGSLSIVRHVSRELTIVLHGEDVAVSSVIVDLGGNLRGEAFAGTFRYSRTWRRRAGSTWRIIAGAVVAVASSPRG